MKYALLFLSLVLSHLVYGQTAKEFTIQGDKKMAEGNILGAIKDYTSAIESDGNYALAYLGRGALYAELDEFEDALLDLEKAQSINPDLSEVHFNKAFVLVNQGKLQDALQEYSKYILANPNDAMGYLARAELFLMLEQHNSAKENFLAYINNSGDLFDDEMAKAEVYLKIGDTTSSLKSLEKCLQLDPSNYKLFVMRGLIYSNQEDYHKALADFSTAIVLSEQADLYVARADVYSQMGEYDFAVQDIQSAIEKDPTRAEYFFLKGYFQLETKDYKNALKSLVEAKELGCTTDGEFYYNLGLAQYNSGDHVSACDSWSRSQGQAYELTQKYCTGG